MVLYRAPANKQTVDYCTTCYVQSFVRTVSKIVSAGPRGEPAPVRQVFCRVFTPSFKYKN